jgi:hypothetical protein
MIASLIYVPSKATHQFPTGLSVHDLCNNPRKRKLPNRHTLCLSCDEKPRLVCTTCLDLL